MGHTISLNSTRCKKQPSIDKQIKGFRIVRSTFVKSNQGKSAKIIKKTPNMPGSKLISNDTILDTNGTIDT